MSDNKTKKGSADRTRINKNESYEMAYWTRKWSISPQQLRGAIRATGSVNVKKLQEYLKKKGAIK